MMFSHPYRLSVRCALIFLMGLNVVLGCSCPPRPTPTDTGPDPDPPVTYEYRAVRAYPHDTEAFTQGLVYDNGVLYESTGQYGASSLRRVALDTGEVLQIHLLEGQYFAEGLALWNNTLIQLTWRSHIGFVYGKEQFDVVRDFSYLGEGWGLTHDGERLIMSDGTDTLRFLDPETFESIGALKVADHGVPVTRLNELEYVEGEILANIWQQERIARIDPASGQVLGYIDLTGLIPENERTETMDVLNGIAYDPDQKRLFVTGKYWPKLFELQMVPIEESAAAARK